MILLSSILQRKLEALILITLGFIFYFEMNRNMLAR